MDETFGELTALELTPEIMGVDAIPLGKRDKERVDCGCFEPKGGATLLGGGWVR
jgi:hypothetical protein